MSLTPYQFEDIETGSAGHCLNEKVSAVYKLSGYIERRFHNGANGEAVPYWAYVENGGKETGLQSAESADVLQRLMTHGYPKTKIKEKIGKIQRLFFGLHQQEQEPIKKESVLKIVSNHFSAFTVVESTGYYNGEAEPTLIIEVAAGKLQTLENLARSLADAFDQDAVGIETSGIYHRIFGKSG